MYAIGKNIVSLRQPPSPLTLYLLPATANS